MDADPHSLKRKLDELRGQRDEFKTTVASQDKLITSLGLDTEEKISQVKRLMALAGKEGGLDELERRLALFKQRQKLDYEAVVLGSVMSLVPNDVVCIKWDGNMESIATIAAEPYPNHPMDLHVKLCLRDDSKRQISTVIKAEPSNIHRVHQSKLDHVLRRVLDDKNVRKLHAHNSGGDALEAFRARLWKDMYVVIRSRFPECTGQLMSVAKALGLIISG